MKVKFPISIDISLYLQVTLMGMGAFLGGMMTLTPECLQPRMAPPLASTMNETKNLTKECKLNSSKRSHKIPGS